MREFTIAVGSRVNSKTWKNTKVTWEQLCGKLSKTIYTSETVQEYKHFVKEAKQEAKDHGGFVGGKLKTTQRLKNNVEFRSLVTLDLDDAELGFIDRFKSPLWGLLVPQTQLSCSFAQSVPAVSLPLARKHPE